MALCALEALPEKLIVALESAALCLHPGAAPDARAQTMEGHTLIHHRNGGMQQLGPYSQHYSQFEALAPAAPRPDHPPRAQGYYEAQPYQPPAYRPASPELYTRGPTQFADEDGPAAPSHPDGHEFYAWNGAGYPEPEYFHPAAGPHYPAEYAEGDRFHPQHQRPPASSSEPQYAPRYAQEHQQPYYQRLDHVPTPNFRYLQFRNFPHFFLIIIYILP